MGVVRGTSMYVLRKEIVVDAYATPLLVRSIPSVCLFHLPRET